MKTFTEEQKRGILEFLERRCNQTLTKDDEIEQYKKECNDVLAPIFTSFDSAVVTTPDYARFAKEKEENYLATGKMLYAMDAVKNYVKIGELNKSLSVYTAMREQVFQTGDGWMALMMVIDKIVPLLEKRPLNQTYHDIISTAITCCENSEPLLDFQTEKYRAKLSRASLDSSQFA